VGREADGAERGGDGDGREDGAAQRQGPHQ
jgi:hypothetical protein